MNAIRVLVVRGGALGDTILTLPLLASLRNFLPGSRVTFVGNNSCLEILPAGIDSLSIDGSAQLWLFSDSLNVSDRFWRVFDIACLILGNPHHVARNLMRAGVPSIRHVNPTPACGEHLVERLHRGLGLEVPPRLPALQYLASPRSDSLVWIHPGSGGSSKCAPLRLFADLSRLIRDHFNHRIVVTASHQDSFLMSGPEWSDLIDQPRTDLVLDRPLGQLCKELGGAALFIGNDSGVSHLAAALGIPSFVFFVTTDPDTWAPWAPLELLRIIDCRRNMPPISHIWTTVKDVL